MAVSGGRDTMTEIDVGLCVRCAHHRVVVSARGSSFHRCGAKDLPKYPRLPVIECAAFVPQADAGPE